MKSSDNTFFGQANERFDPVDLELSPPERGFWTDEEMLKARVVLIFKKGDTNKFENYRPISLLNTLYKILAVIIQRRIAQTLDKHLQNYSQI